ncbi:MAG: SAM-dependent methyltransferase [Actinomycetota bacterium]|nr:SAM-dependent methyltransferase [Actinomycetota bacterium]
MQPEFEKIELRPIKLRDQVLLQTTSLVGTKSKTANLEFGKFATRETLSSGFANCLIEATDLTITIRFTKKGEPQIHTSVRELVQKTTHDRQKSRLLDPNNEFLKKVGISDGAGRIKPSMNDKYLQIEEFLRILMPTLKSEISAGRIHQPSPEAPLRIVDHGCGNAYLTFAVHNYLMEQDIPNQVIGIDQREDSRRRNTAIAIELENTDSIEFRAEKIADSGFANADLAIALHACDTATDDALAWSIRNHVKMLLVSPCCHHDLQTQFEDIPAPWTLVTKHGILKERFGDILTDALRAQILRLHGYRCEIIEFIGDEHTPRNLLIRATLTYATPDPEDLSRFREIVKSWSIRPKLAEILDFS